MKYDFNNRKSSLIAAYKELVETKNTVASNNGVYERFTNPVLTAAHIPLEWRIDFNIQSNPFLMERFGINAVFNAA